jgi:hypothetical protein
LWGKRLVEPVNGNIKYNKKFNQFSVRGQRKSKIEFILICIAHNIDKIHYALNNITQRNQLPARQTA